MMVLLKEFEAMLSYEMFFGYDASETAHKLARVILVKGKFRLSRATRTSFPHDYSYRDPLVSYVRNEYAGTLVQVLLRDIPTDLFGALCKLHGLSFSNYEHPVVNLFDAAVVRALAGRCPAGLLHGLNQRLSLVMALKEAYPRTYSVLDALPVDLRGCYRVMAANHWNPMGEVDFLETFNVMFFHTNPNPLLRARGSVRGLYKVLADGKISADVGLSLDRRDSDEPIPTLIVNAAVGVLFAVRKYCKEKNTDGYVPLQKLISEFTARSIDRNPIPMAHPKGTDFKSDSNVWFSAVVNFYLEAAFGSNYSVVAPP